MKITILYFGVLKSTLQIDRETLEWQGGSGDDLLALLRARGPVWQEALAPENIFRLVINKTISPWHATIPDDAEVGLLPPVTGG